MFLSLVKSVIFSTWQSGFEWYQNEMVTNRQIWQLSFSHSLAHVIIHSHSLECSDLLSECWFIGWKWSSNIWIFGRRQNYCPPISMNVYSGEDGVRSGRPTKVYHSNAGVVVAGNGVIGRRWIQEHRTDLILRMGVYHCNRETRKG